ncbi:structural maintenance of chromosomes protein 6-like isoform X2 [Bolinopsis microptera]|uniref:structural maintenance of chromosomes protein 6-like isoform X2 n=1 Tax=Bolinopsis microptera TaxID=2820187 RepID=UPI00307AA0D7
MKIELQNFMCHTFFEVEFCSTVNFVVGRNGSGKSAILMALVIGLGGKSSATNRAPNMTEFIKQGSSWGQVTITICNSNHNHDAWEVELYGSAVLVERKITKQGSKYKLKNFEGKTISTKKNDLTLLLDHYNIQVNNPVSILNQEMSKKFLASTDPGSKYNFFMKSTHLEQMILDYQQVNEKLETIKHTIAKKERTIPDVRAQVRHLKSQYDEITELRDMGKKVSQLKDELIWSKALETEMSEDMRMYQSLESDQASLRQLAHAKKRELLEVQRKIKTANNSIKDLNMDRQRLTKRIREIEDSNKARNVEAEKAERDQELAECRDKQGQYTEEMTSTTSTMEHLESRLSDMTVDLSRIRQDIEQTDVQIRKHQDMLRTQQEAKKNRVSVFGRFMPDLLRKVDEADRLNRFNKKPRGPFGLHMKVKDPKWANVIELAIGGLAVNFVVHDQHDKLVLQDLFRKSCSNPREHPNMIMMKFRDEAYDVSSQKPQTGHPTMYDMLDIDDHVISNALVEQARLEQSLLIESSEEARMLIIGHAPPRVHNAWTLAGDDVRARGAYSNDPTKNNRYFRDDPSQVIEEINHKIRQLREQSSIQRQNKGGVEKEVNDIRAQYNTEKKKQQAIKRKLENVRNRIIELDNVDEAPLLDATALEDEMRQYGEQINNINEEKEGLAEKEETLKQEHEEANKRHAESTERDSHITNRLEELKGKMHEGQKKNTQLLDVLEKYKRKKKEVNTEKKRFNAELTAKKREISEAQGMAEQRCPRVDTRRSAKDLEQQIRNMELRIQQGSSSTVNVDNITRRFHDAKTKFEDIQTMVKKMRKFSGDLQEILKEREERYFRFRKEISKRINYFFIMNLSQRGYTGKLKVDHEKKVLEMKLNVDTSGASQDIHDVRSLSGGERSFSTVCFICSLWNLMESPFRCLDEFDVFMDLMNRKVAMKLLVEHAVQNQQRRQYILFTPQDMSHFNKKFKNMKIMQLEAPERNDDNDE